MRSMLPFSLGLLAGAPLSWGPPQEPSGGPDYDRTVAPILSELCFDCHGPDGAARQAGLRLDTREGVLEVAEPGSRTDSELWSRIRSTDPDLRMPPPETGEILSPDQVETLGAWIDAGVPVQAHWAFVAPQPQASPAITDPLVAGRPFIADEIDAFVLAALEENGLRPSPPASPATLLRRVTLDLTGLPPTPLELDAFLADPSDGAYAAAVDALLDSPRHAEHVTTEWLDGARYADTNGYQNDFARHQWPWRDWVLRSFQAGQPYDEFALEQIAGDLLPGATRDQILATGFQRNHRTVTEAGSLDEEWRVENVVDRVETTSTVFLGLTMGCARCHDHKYDPITQAEFFGLYGFFNSIDEKGVYEETRGNVAPLIEVPGPEHVAGLAEIGERLEAAQAELKSATEAAEPERAGWIDGLGSTAWKEPHVHAGFPEPLVLEGALKRAPFLASEVPLAADQAFSVAAWVRAESHGAIWAKMADDDTYRGADLVLFQDGRAAAHLIHDWPENAIKVVTEEPLPLGVWMHLTVAYDGSGKAAGLRILRGGVPLATRIEADSLSAATDVAAPLRLGTRRYAGELRGSVGDLRVLDHAPPQGLDLAWPQALAADPDQAGTLRAIHRDAYAATLVAARERVAELRSEREDFARSVPTAMVLAERTEPRPTYVLDRGRYDAPRTDHPITPHVPAVLGALPAEAPPDRLALARWITSPANPLFARVQVNRVWKRFFGRGLAASQENFGVQGDRPSHPALLDSLALSFVESGYDQRELERRIVLSSTYRQSSKARPADYERDPGNALLSRGPRYRLDAEAIRDSALFVSGLLVERLGGPPTRPYQPPGLWSELAGGAGQGPYVQDTGEGLWRRSLYTHRKRTVPHPTLATLDAPGFEICQVRRARTNTPLQVLALLNDVTYVEASRALAERVANEHPGDVQAQLRSGFRRCTGRLPAETELATLRGGYDRRLENFRAAPQSAAELLAVGESRAPDPSPELAALATTMAVILNLDETLTKQ